MKKNWRSLPPKIRKTELINEEIHFAKVLVIDEKNQNLGTMTIQKALTLAASKKLDLICVNKQVALPICKILSYENYRFQKQKKEKKYLKTQKKPKIKEVQISAGIANHDLEIKIKKTQQFLQKKYKVKVTMRLKGREKYLTNYGLDKINFFLAALKEEMILVKPPKLKNNVYNLFLEAKMQKSPEKKNAKK